MNGFSFHSWVLALLALLSLPDVEAAKPIYTDYSLSELEERRDAIDAGEEMPSGDDSALIEALESLRRK